MMLFRAAELADLDAVVALADSAGIGVTTLPASREVLHERLERAERSFQERCSPEEAVYFFALEDTRDGRVVGVSALQARVGLNEVWYNYRVANTVNASRELGLHRQTPTLYLSNDMTGCSELCTLFLHADARNGANGHLLSKARSLFLADFPGYFSSKVFAEMRGVSDATGRSPFWESLGHKFFTLDFSVADYLTGVGNKAFIAELMPKYPIYLPFLSATAQAAVAQVHEQTRPALALLQSEGFNYNGLIDIFDAGPVVEAFLPQIRTVRESECKYVVVSRATPPVEEPNEPLYMIANRRFRQFRVGLLGASRLRGDSVIVPAAMAEQLGIEGGDTVRIAALKGRGA